MNRLPTENVHLDHRKDIDGLRAVAVLSVIGFHVFPRWVPGGFVGVDIFFVISGYLISGIIFKTLDKGYFSFIDFYRKRIKRIFPALIIVLIACYIAGWFVLIASDFKFIGEHLFCGIGFLSNFILLGETGYFDSSAKYKIFMHLWSLGIEEQFYAAFPLFVFLTFHKQYFFKLLVGIIIVSFMAGLIALNNNPSVAFYLPHYRAWELLLGVLLSYGENKKTNYFNLKSFGYLNTLGIIGFILTITSVFLLEVEDPYPGWRALLPIMGTMMLIAAGNNSFINRKICASRFFVFVGLISYPLYLWHWPIIVFTKDIILYDLSTIQKMIIVLTSILLAYLTYRFVELPVKKTSKPITTSLILIALSISMLGYWTYSQNGLASRFPAFMNNLMDVKVLNGTKVDKKTIDDMNEMARQEYGCFLFDNNKPQAFGNNCIENDFKNNEKSLFLWGDSYAGMLYSGIINVKMTYPFSLAQFSVASCVPFISPTDKNAYELKYCKALREFIISKIIALKPNTIMLAGRWDRYDLSNLSETVSFLKEQGVKHVIIVGMPPIWSRNNISLPQILITKYYLSFQHTIPNRLWPEDFSAQQQFDSRLKKITEDNGAIYISSLDVFCDSSGCLTLQGDTVTELTSIDFEHLTKSASIYFMKKALPPVLHTIWETTNLPN